MVDIENCQFDPNLRPPAGEGSFTLTVNFDLVNDDPLNDTRVLWNVGTLYDGVLHSRQELADETVIPAGDTIGAEWSHTFANDGGSFFPANRTVSIAVFITNISTEGQSQQPRRASHRRATQTRRRWR